MAYRWNCRKENWWLLSGPTEREKTTTLSTISGVKRAFSGQIVYDGKDITKAGTDEIVKMGIVQVPEGRQIFSKMTIEENLILGAYTEKDSQRQKQNMKRVMELFPILRERRRQTAGDSLRRGTADAGYRPGADGKSQNASSG